MDKIRIILPRRFRLKISIFLSYQTFIPVPGFWSLVIVRDFHKVKVQWGAGPVALDWRRIGHQGVQKLASTQKSELKGQVGNIWKHLPLALCNTCGPLLRRYVSL